PKLMTVASEAPCAVESDTLFDGLENVCVAAFIANYKKPESSLLHHLEGLVINVGARVGRPRDAQRFQQLRDLARAPQVGGKSIVIEEEFLHFRELRFHRGDFFVNVLGTANSVLMPLRYLRP